MCDAFDLRARARVFFFFFFCTDGLGHRRGRGCRRPSPLDGWAPRTRRGRLLFFAGGGLRPARGGRARRREVRQRVGRGRVGAQTRLKIRRQGRQGRGRRWYATAGGAAFCRGLGGWCVDVGGRACAGASSQGSAAVAPPALRALTKPPSGLALRPRSARHSLHGRIRLFPVCCALTGGDL